MIHRQTLSRLFIAVRNGTSSFAFHLLFAGLVTVLVFLYAPSIFSGDTDTARNYLNTIVSSLSTILALCISIILVAIQMTAGNYTHRVLDFYVRLPYNVSLFFFYLVTIMHSLFLMARIRDPLNDPLPRDLSNEMSADLVLVVICFLSLLLYMYAVVQLLKPERIIELIDREYNRAFAIGRLKAAQDSVEQICDIAKRAASFCDSLTGTHCLTVMSRIAAQLPLPTTKDDPLFSIHANIVDQWVEIVGVAVKERDTGVLTGVLNALSKQGVVYVEGESWRCAELVIRAYRHLASGHLLAEGHIYYVERVVERLYHLAALSSAKGPRGQTFALRTWQIARAIGAAAVRTHPNSAFPTIDGLLMFEQFQPTMTNLTNRAEYAEALISYFELWKLFATHSAQSDMARWARWWVQTIPDKEGTMELTPKGGVHAFSDGESLATSSLFDDGVELAFSLASHLEAHKLTQTLSYVWKIEPRQVGASLKSRLEPFVNLLFDGWPVPSGKSCDG